MHGCKRIMADTRFTALGTSGSGKTCYLLGMYYEMCVGIRGFTLVTTNQAANKLEAWMDKLDDETGMERFPAGTALTEVTDYSFKLSYQTKSIMSFDWADYGGGTLKVREDNPQAFEKLMDSIKESTALYIFIDGDLFCEENSDKRKRNIERKCARTVNSYIQSFADENQNRLPPIVFVVTKSDKCKEYISSDEIYSVLKNAFSSVFGQEIKTYIVAVSLGSELSDDNYSGEVEPINIHIPFFIGIYHEFFNFCCYLKYQIEKDEDENRSLILQNQNAIEYESNKWFFTDNDKINRCREQIQNANEDIESNRELLKKYRKLLGAVAQELTRCSDNFAYFENGKESLFNTEEIFDL